MNATTLVVFEVVLDVLSKLLQRVYVHKDQKFLPGTSPTTMIRLVGL